MKARLGIAAGDTAPSHPAQAYGIAAPMVSIPAGGRLRPALRDALARWADVSVTTEHPHVLTVRRPGGTSHGAPACILVIGENRLDQGMFEHCAVHSLLDFLERGWVVSIIDFGIDPKPSPQTNGTHGKVFAWALAHTPRLQYVTIYTHSRYAINLSETGDDLIAGASSKEPEDRSLPIRDLTLSSSASPDGWIDVFGCLCRDDAQWPTELASVTGWPVRTVFPGYSVYFPAEFTQPRSSIPFTKFLRDARYIRRGWAVWLPGLAQPVRVSEPSSAARRYGARFDTVERWITKFISVGLEPVRDFRKRRLFAAHDRQRATSRNPASQ